VRTKRQLAALFRYLGLRPSRSLGQNFLVDHNLLEFMVRAGEVGPGDLVLDIGCGTGLLTAHLADAAAKVIGIEVDRGLLAICKRHLEGRENVELLLGDVLASKHALCPALLEATRRELATGRYGALRVVSNLPYSVASSVVPNLLESGLPIAGMLVSLQKEVAERLAAGVGEAQYGALSVVVQCQARVEVVRSVPPEVFWPRPKVTSCLVRVTPTAARRAGAGDYEALKRVVRGAFSHRRKTLANSLSAARLVSHEAAAGLLAECGIPPRARAQEVGLEGYAALAARLSEGKEAK